eukprot:7741109-Lingulodinium_polyedra.AAC.1
MQTPVLVFAWSVLGVRFSIRCGNRRWTRPPHCARFQKPCTRMRSNRPSAATTARTSDASHTHANTKTRARM